MKRLLLVSLLIGTNSILAMEAPEPVAKKQKLEEEQLGVQPMEIEQNGFITLISAQGDRLEVAKSALERSPLLSGALELPHENDVFEGLNFLSTSALKAFIPLLEKLDELLSQNEDSDQLNQVYIPRIYQPFVNENLFRLSDQDIGVLYIAGDFFDLPFMSNAVAAVIADRIEGKIDAMEWKKLKAFQREDLINERAAQFGIHVKQEYILKQVTFRKSGITQEYSIADYIAEHGQPQLDGLNTLNLRDKRLTSLFGIDRLHVKNTCQVLDLARNCFFDIALDVQSVPMPFQGFVQLRKLYFDLNQLSNLPEHVFAGLAQLRELWLGHNQLSNLPEHVFAGLAQLDELFLGTNQLSEQEKQRIKEQLPQAIILFD